MIDNVYPNSQTETYVEEIYKDNTKLPFDYRFSDLEKTILTRSFKNKGLLIQALMHKSFCMEYQHRANVNLNPYNVLQFLGNSVLSYFVMEFYYQKSSSYPELYPPKELHKFKKAVMTDLFQGLITVENGIHNYVLLGTQQKHK